MFLTCCRRKYAIRPDATTATGAAAVRLDRWLWAARFFKTRQLASDAVKGGRVDLNGRKARAARPVRVGDVLEIRKERLRYEVTVLELGGKRVGAELARHMYRESDASRTRREEIETLAAVERRAIRFDDHKPGKKDRRALARLKRGPAD